MAVPSTDWVKSPALRGTECGPQSLWQPPSPLTPAVSGSLEVRSMVLWSHGYNKLSKSFPWDTMWEKEQREEKSKEFTALDTCLGEKRKRLGASHRSPP